MEYRQLGNSNLKVSPFCLGTMTFGTQCNENESFKILDYAYNNEVNFIDLFNWMVSMGEQGGQIEKMNIRKSKKDKVNAQISILLKTN